MTKEIYLETLKSVLRRSISHYCQKAIMNFFFFFEKLADSFQALTIFGKKSIVDILQGPEYTSRPNKIYLIGETLKRSTKFSGT